MINLTRREAIKRIGIATILAASLDLKSFGAAGTAGYGLDADLMKKDIPWPLLMTPEERKNMAAFADILVPADEHGPAASKVGVVDFVDEWISAPYEAQVSSREPIRNGLKWLHEESMKRHRKTYCDLDEAQQTAIVEEMVQDKTPAHKQAGNFFKVARDLVTGGYYSTIEGWKAIGYVGNITMVDFPGPPIEVLKHIGLA